MDLEEFIKGALIGVVGDYTIYSVVDSLAKTTPEWAVYGWGLFVAFNGAFALWLKRVLSE